MGKFFIWLIAFILLWLKYNVDNDNSWLFYIKPFTFYISLKSKFNIYRKGKVVIFGIWVILFSERHNVFMNRHYFRQNESMLFIWFVSKSRFYNFLNSLKFRSFKFASHILRSVSYSLLPIIFVEFKGLNVIYNFFKDGRFI